MKVFEVITEHCIEDSKEITKSYIYVISDDDKLQTVADYYTQHCFEYEKDLVSIREVLTVAHHIKSGD